VDGFRLDPKLYGAAFFTCYKSTLVSYAAEYIDFVSIERSAQGQSLEVSASGLQDEIDERKGGTKSRSLGDDREFK